MTTTEMPAPARIAAPARLAASPRMAASPRILACWYETGKADLRSHLSVHGPLPRAGRNDSHFAFRLIEAVERSGLTGRGGAGFPTSRKWELMRQSRQPLVLVNAMEGEPASEKDRFLLAGAPHLVLDGAELAAAAVGAREILVCVAEDRPDSARNVQRAIDERAAKGVGSRPVSVLQPPGRYISGEESALVNWVGGGGAIPTFRPQKGTPLRIRRRPALVQNAETLAHVALIARHGSDWFRMVGPPEAPGTSLVSASGALERPGIYEVALGTPVSEILRQAGSAESPAAVLVGGYGGTWLGPGLLETPYAPGPLAAAGSAMGAGVLGVLGASTCGVAETARIASYMAAESAGQCGPCVYGLPAIAADLALLARGHADRSVLERLRRHLEAVAGRGACRHPDGVVRLVRSAVAVFAADFAEHARGRPCRGAAHRPLMSVPSDRRELR